MADKKQNKATVAAKKQNSQVNQKKLGKNDGLLLKRHNVHEKYGTKYDKESDSFSNEYIEFLNASKTEREAVKYITKMLHKKGFIDIDEKPDIKSHQKTFPKPKGFYRLVHGKAVLVFVDGKSSVENGVNIIGAHIDAPRIDLKPNPIYEDAGMSYFKTHYYGGIKKYQWAAIPLAIHGVFVKEDGKIVEISIGEKDSDPVFTITDLLPHLAQEQMQKKLADGIGGEDLNLLIGSIPLDDGDSKEKTKEKMKVNILKILNKSYGINEEDFVSAEIEIVPAFRAREVGFDRSLIGSYGQDDRVCSFTALKAILDIKSPQIPAICFLSDKEEIGSYGNTGADSRMFENFIVDICYMKEFVDPSYSARLSMSKSTMISADVNAAFDPAFASVYEKSNASFVGKGVVITKYTGSRGKSGASDANPEFVAMLRNIFNKNDIVWQASELGKVDQGGGGTIALHFARLGIDVIDAGVALLSMHSPFEVASKMDIYTFYRACKVFYER